MQSSLPDFRPREGNILFDYWDLKTRETVYGMKKQEVGRGREFHIEFKQ